MALIFWRILIFLIYLLEGRPETKLFADFSFAVSFVTEIELLGRKDISDVEKQIVQELLTTCFIIDLLPTIKAKAIWLKQRHRIKLPDELVAATAMQMGLPLLTVDKGFSALPDLDLVLMTFLHKQIRYFTSLLLAFGGSWPMAL